MGVTDQPHRQRRRGEELEAALLAAAWDELVEAGFHRLTIGAVFAARAKTGVAPRNYVHKLQLGYEVRAMQASGKEVVIITNNESEAPVSRPNLPFSRKNSPK